ncbi:MAG: prealbumin-like fold domain-containing protein [Clostridia bacterium]|nr:prealbumin-like fold domain-containing protein [Clostridia bacterium]
MVETETQKEYVLTEETKTIELKENEIKSIKFENEKIKGYVEITKVDSKTKEKLSGAKFGIYNEKDEKVGELVTDKDGKAKSDLLVCGKYYLKELDTGSPYYLLNEDTFEFEIVENHETVPVEIENEEVEITVDVDKKGTVEIKPGEEVNYEFSNVANTSNIYLENFEWIDYIPTDYVRLQTMMTGTWNQELTYNVYYKTNKSENYILRYNDLTTTENHLLDFTDVELDEDEYITETCFGFGEVQKGFKEDEKPTMTCKSLDTLEDGEVFTNKTKTVGTYFNLKAEANSKWTTIVHKPVEKHEEILPRTGK